MATQPDEAPWGLNEQLAATLVDLTALLVWMRQNEGRKGPATPRPRQIPRPGVVDERATTRYGTALDREAALAILRPLAPPQGGEVE